MSIDKHAVNHHILSKQHLLRGQKSNSPLEVINDLLALDSNNLINTYFSLHLRVNGFDERAFEKALYKSAGIVRAKGLKNYIQIIPAGLMPRVYSISKDMREDSVNKLLESWNISEDEYRIVRKAIRASLDDKEKTLPQLKNSIPGGIVRDIEKKKSKKKKEKTTNVAIIAAAMWDRWELLRGGIGAEPAIDPGRYSLPESRFKGIKLDTDRKTALISLAGRYIKQYGPVTQSDIAWWCGITENEAAAAIESLDTAKIEIEGIEGEFYIDPSDERSIGSGNIESSVILLPRDDPYIKAYNNRQRFLPSEYEDFTINKFGESASIVLINGIAWGFWYTATEKWGDVCKVELLEGYPEVEGLEEMVREAAAGAGAFYTGEKTDVILNNRLLD